MSNPEPGGLQQITDPAFPDLVGVVGGPMIPCKVVEVTATMAPTTRVEGVGDLDAHYEHTQRYVIRYQPATWPREKLMPAFVWGDKGWWYRQALTEYWGAHGLAPKPHAAPDEVQRAVDWWNQRAGGEPAAPVHISYMAATPTPQEVEAAKRAVLETAAEVAREQQTAGRQETCCVCGSPHVGYHNYKNQPFCWPCADGEPLLQVVHVVRHEGPTSEVFAGPFTGDEAQAWIDANRTDKWTMCQVATLQRPAVVPERERLVHENPALAAQIREGVAEAERGDTTDLGSFAQHLDEGDDDD